MSENEFASQLINAGLAPTMDPAALVAAAMSRNKRRIRMLVTLTIGLWVIAFLMAATTWMPVAAMMKQKAVLLDRAISGQSAPLDVNALAVLLKDLCLRLAAWSGFILAITTLASLFAAISTVWLVLTVRRVTLEQVSMGLAQISQQLQRIESSGKR